MKSSIVGIWAVINQTFLSPPYSRNINIISDREFSTSNHMFSEKCKLFYKTNYNRKIIEKPHMNILQRYFSNSLEDPVKLQEFAWFNLCLHFCRMGREGWRKVLKKHFKILTDTGNHRYVTIVFTESRN